MANWESYRIADAIDDIEEHKFVLPVIQRRLVWDEEKMVLLFDTLLKGDSFGGIMVIKEQKGYPPLFNYRYFTKNGNIEKSIESGELHQMQSFVIDGQQRLQTFYIGLLGSINGKILYFDLFSNYKEQFEFSFASSFKELPQISKNDSLKTIKKYQWIPASSLLQKLKQSGGNDRQLARTYCKDNKIQDEAEITHVAENMNSFMRNIITQKSLGVSEVIIDKDGIPELANKQRIVELFNRLNSSGTPLSSFDLVASKLKGFDWQMESYLENTLLEFASIGLTQDNLIKLFFILQDDHSKEMSEITISDAIFVMDKGTRIIECLHSLRRFLIYTGLDHYYQEKNRSFIPLFFITYHLFHSNIKEEKLSVFFDNHDTGNKEFPHIKKWIYNSLINGVFRSRGAGWIPYRTGIRKILDEMKKHKGASFPIQELYKVYQESNLHFKLTYDVGTLDSLDSAFVYYLMYEQAQTIRTQDIDHIMPKSILLGLQVNLEEINSIKNYQLIDYSTNRGEKNDKPLAQWLNNHVKEKTAFVKKHLIPVDELIWKEDKFTEFKEARGSLILDKILNYTA